METLDPRIQVILRRIEELPNDIWKEKMRSHTSATYRSEVDDFIVDIRCNEVITSSSKGFGYIGLGGGSIGLHIFRIRVYDKKQIPAEDDHPGLLVMQASQEFKSRTSNLFGTTFKSETGKLGAIANLYLKIDCARRRHGMPKVSKE